MSSGVVRITVDLPTPSLNETQRMHWAKKLKEKRKWYFLLLEARGRWRTKFTFHGRAIITRYGAKELDFDNLVGGMKECVVDNLAYLRLIKDDNPESVSIEYRQVYGKKAKPYRTEIELR